MLREEVGILASFRDQRIEHEASVQSSRTLPGREARAEGVHTSAHAVFADGRPLHNVRTCPPGNRRPCPARRECQPGDGLREATTADAERWLFLYSEPSASSSAVSSFPSS